MLQQVKYWMARFRIAQSSAFHQVAAQHSMAQHGTARHSTAQHKPLCHLFKAAAVLRSNFEVLSWRGSLVGTKQGLESSFIFLENFSSMVSLLILVYHNVNHLQRTSSVSSLASAGNRQQCRCKR